MSDTQNNIIRFNYSVDPTTLMSNSWITTNTDTTQNTVTGVGKSYWRTITFNFTGKEPFGGVFRIKVDENGIPDTSVFESISGDRVVLVNYGGDALQFNGSNGGAGGICSNFSSATENTPYTETRIAGTWSYVQSDYVITHYWRTVTVTDTTEPSGSGVIKIEVSENGVPLTDGQDISNYSVLSGYSDIIALMYYGGKQDGLVFIGPDKTYAVYMNDFSVSSENTTLQLDNTQGDAGTWSYVASTTTETVYDHYEVELYVNSDVTTFPNNLFYDDSHITSIEFNTYSITSIEDGYNVGDPSGAFDGCLNLSSAVLPNNLEYIGNYAFSNTLIRQITLPSTIEEIGSNGLHVNDLSITSLATVPPILHTNSISNRSTLTIHETALQSYINSDWTNYVRSISTIETPTYDNVLKFNYSGGPNGFLNNLWVNYCTDTSANTVVGTGEQILQMSRTVTFNFSGKRHFAGVFRIVVDENGVPVQPLNFESISGDEVTGVVYDASNDILGITGTIVVNPVDLTSFSTAIENTTYTELHGGTWSYEASQIEVYSSYEVTLYINSALNTFETTMFADDDNITSVEFDYDVTSIIDDAFNGCENLSSVTLTSTVPPTIGEDTFSLISPDAVLYVPNGAQGIYRSEFGDIFPEIRAIDVPPFAGYGFNLNDMLDVDYIEQYRRR